VFIIGIDPHKGSHHATVVDHTERVISEVRVRADRHQRERLLTFAASFTPRTWAIEGAAGLGALLARQLVAVGETVLDVPAKLSARVRMLDSELSDKTDSHDARSAAIVGLRHRRLRAVTGEDHRAVLRMLAKRHHDLTARRTQSVCRLHAVLCVLVAGGLPKNLSAQRASSELRRIRPVDAVGVARREIAAELLAEVRHVDTGVAGSPDNAQSARREGAVVEADRGRWTAIASSVASSLATSPPSSSPRMIGPQLSATLGRLR
jgi:transposase